ncbi:GNAT family N-acetyltransferase [Calothrix sp. 336/3]|nr:acetyltransferase [Calothrix sp. 336/3]
MSLILDTPRLLLKPILASQVDTLHHILTDSYVRRYLCDDQILSLEKTTEMLMESLRLFAQENFGLWLIETKTEGEIIGFVGLWYFFEEEQPQLAYALLPQGTKKGYATEAATRIVNYCFQELGYGYVIASCDRPNVESQKVATRIGMRQIEERMINGNPVLFWRMEKPQTEVG